MKKIILAAIAGASAVALTGCGSDTASDAPPYEVVKESGDQIVAEVDSADGLKAVFDDITSKLDEDGGYFVSINCSTGGTGASDNRLANGRYAVGSLGEAQTGLSDGQGEFETNPGATCP